MDVDPTAAAFVHLRLLCYRASCSVGDYDEYHFRAAAGRPEVDMILILLLWLLGVPLGILVLLWLLGVFH
jgi:hypothetical protein